MKSKRDPRGKIGAGMALSVLPHPGFCALVRHMARVAAEHDYGLLIEQGVQPDRSSDGDNGKGRNLRTVLK